MIERIPLLVAGLSLIVILKPNVSEDTCHCMPRALSIGRCSKSKFLTEVARSFSGIDSTTSRELDTHFFNRKPLFFNSSVNS